MTLLRRHIGDLIKTRIAGGLDRRDRKAHGQLIVNVNEHPRRLGQVRQRIPQSIRVAKHDRAQLVLRCTIDVEHMDDLRLKVRAVAGGAVVLGLERGRKPVLLGGEDGRDHEIDEQEERDIDHAREIERDAFVATSRWFDSNSHERLPGYLRGQSRGTDPQRLKPVEKIVQGGGVVISVGTNEQLDIARIAGGKPIDFLLNDLEQFFDPDGSLGDLDAPIREKIDHQTRLLRGLLLLAFLLGKIKFGPGDAGELGGDHEEDDQQEDHVDHRCELYLNRS